MIWIEIRCDALGIGCRTDDGPKGGSTHNRTSMKARLVQLEHQALAEGWKRRRDASWLCPTCAKEIGL